MILLSSDCLLFQLADGESIPLSAEAISIELIGDASRSLSPEFVQDAAAAVFHYFTHELARETVTVGEFSQALENVLRGFGLTVTRPVEFAESDLRHLAVESGTNELLFFPRLRDELRAQLRQSPRRVRFSGLRSCVKQLAGSRRWSPRCRHLEEQILAYLRQCFQAESRQKDCLLVVE
jgi:hypothetical protein